MFSPVKRPFPLNGRRQTPYQDHCDSENKPVHIKRFRMCGPFEFFRFPAEARHSNTIDVMKLSTHKKKLPAHDLRLRGIALMLCVSYVTTSPCLAQTSPTSANPQNPSTQSLQAGVDPSSSALAATPIGSTPSVAATQGLASIPSSSRPGSLRSAGQGLPGMLGGPPIKGSLGYQDPSSAYMRPRTIGPLLCDPLVDGLCD